MKIYWGVIRIWYVSTTCKSTDFLLQYFYMNGSWKIEVMVQCLLIFRHLGDVLFFLYARRLRGYTATLPLFVKRHSHGQSSFLYSMRSAHRWLFHIEITSVQSSQNDQSPLIIRIINEDLGSLMRVGEFISPHQQAEIIIYDSNYYWWLVILWTLDTCDFNVEQSSMSRAHRHQNRRLTMGMSFHKEGECRSISAKPTSTQKEKDIPRLPENYKKLYQYFRLFYFHSYNNIAVIYHCFYM